MQINGSANDGVAFAQGGGDEGREKKYVDRTKVTCFKCGVRGHYATECTGTAKKTDTDAEATLVNVTPAGTATPINETTRPPTDISHEHFDEADHVHFQFLQHSGPASTNHRSVMLNAGNTNHRSVMLNQGAVTVPKAWIQSLRHISEPTRLLSTAEAGFC